MNEFNKMENEGRDDFSQPTKDLIAKRSGYICAYPNCKRMTVAGSDDRKSGLTLTGVAAHITAASQKGPRYDPSMSKDERGSAANGIWMCQIHGKLIDDNASRCSTVELHRWKAQHEKWVFDRVESGFELLYRGVSQISFGGVGVFSDNLKVALRRNNILVGDNESGKTSFCEILSAFSGGDHWKQFNRRFSFSKRAANHAYIQLSYQDDGIVRSVRISPQVISAGRKKTENLRQRIHVEVDGCPSFDWPRSMLRILYFKEQLYRTHHSDPKDSFVKALRYLATVFGTTEDFVWDSLREEFFTNSTFGYRFRRAGHRSVEVLVPDGRDFFLHHGSLSSTEKQLAFLEIALKLVSCASGKESWVYIFDTDYFQRLHPVRKSEVFKKLAEFTNKNVQTVFCLNSVVDAELLKNIHFDKWVNAERFGELTMHSFL